MATRTESVRLELLDEGFSTGMAKDAAAVALLKRELDSVGGSSTKAGTSTRSTTKDFDDLGRSADNSGKSIDKYSGRLSLLGQTLGAFGPALVPLSAAAIPAISGIASELGFAAIGAGTALLAFNGLGEALKAFNKASLEPTAANIGAAQVAFDKISPSAQEFVLQLRKLSPELDKIKAAAGSGLFPGLTAGLADLQGALPAVERILSRVSAEIGNLAADAGKSLGGPEWAGFLKFIGDEAPLALDQLGHSVGSVVHGLAELWMAFAPLNSGFSAGLEGVAKGFDDWASSLSKTQGFSNFIDYIRTTGPEVEGLLSSLASTLVDITKAAGPLGGPLLQGLTAVLDVVDDIAKSKLGTPILALISALSLLKLATRSWGAISEGAVGSFVAGQRKAVAAVTQTIGAQERATLSATELAAREKQVAGGYTTLGNTALTAGTLVAGMTLQLSGASKAMGLSNATTGAMAGSLVGPWGTAVGAGVGALLDWKAANEQAAAAVAANNAQVDHLISSGNIAGLAKYADGASQVFAVASKFQAQGYDFGAALDPGQKAIDDFGMLSGALEKFQAGVKGNQFVDYTTSTAKLGQIATQIQPAMDRLGITFKDLAAMTPAHLDATVSKLVQTTAAMKNGQAGTQDVARAFGALNKEAAATTAQVGDLKSALDALLDPKLNLSASHDAYIAGLHSLQSELDKTSKTLDGNSDAALKNRAAIRSNVSDIKSYIEAQADAGVSPQKMTSSLKQQRQALLDAGEAAGISKNDMNDYLNTLGLTPKLIKTVIQAQDSQALAAIGRVKTSLDGLKNKDIYVTVHQNGQVNTTGGHVPGIATGGLITGPGSPTSDSIPAYLSNGEYVMKASAVAKYGRHMFDNLNAMHFADGGPVNARHRPDVNGGIILDSGLWDNLGREFRSLTKDVSQSRATLQKETAQRAKLIDDRNQLASTVTSSLRSDLFGQTVTTPGTPASDPVNAWLTNTLPTAATPDVTTAVSPTAVLQQDIANSKAMIAAENKLRSMGLHGAALAYVESQGLAATQQIAGGTAADVSQFQTLFDQRQKLSGQAGQIAGDQRYGTQIDKQTQEIVKSRMEMQKQTQLLREVKAAIKAKEDTKAAMDRAAAEAARKRKHRTSVINP